MQIRAFIEIHIDPSQYTEKEELIANSDKVRELVHSMLDGEADIPKERNIRVEYVDVSKPSDVAWK